MLESKLKVGVDVPWVTSWSAEDVVGAGPCASVFGRLALRQTERPGLGKPQYSMNHLRRQRQSVSGMLCPMCGRPTLAADRWTQVARRRPLGVVRARAPDLVLPPSLPDDRIVIDAGSIAPLHAACVKRSLEYCPHLRGHPAVEVRAFPQQWIVAPLMVEALAPPLQAFLAAPRRPPPPAISFLQILGVTPDSDRRWRRQLEHDDFRLDRPPLDRSKRL